MTPMQMIAHRGLWHPDSGQQNGLAACRDAFAAGYGVEIDVRRAPNGVLVLSHDPVRTGDPRPVAAFENFLALAQRFPSLPVLIDLKELGTEGEIANAVERVGLADRSWLFDFEIAGIDPRAVQGLSADGRSRFLARVSDRGEGGEIPRWAGGVLLDQWESDWVTRDVLEHYLTLDLPAFVIAPELQGRALDLGRLPEWEGATGLVTDAPHLISSLDRSDLGGPLYPESPWWAVRP